MIKEITLITHSTQNLTKNCGLISTLAIGIKTTN